MNYSDATLKRYLKDLGDRVPAPGGGSVAALSASSACALVMMGCAYTLGKTKYKKFERTAEGIFKKAKAAQKVLSRLLDQDVVAYQRKDIKRSIEIPIQVFDIASEMIPQAFLVLKNGNRLLSLDLVLAIMLLEVSCIASFLYADVNVRAQAKGCRGKYTKRLKCLKASLNRLKNIRQKAEVVGGLSS